MSHLSWIKYGVLKGLRYRINTISWFLADISMYSSTILMYVLLSSVYDNFGFYTQQEMGFYISTYFLINNIYATFFSEASSSYENSILNGTYSYYQLTPTGVLKSLIMLNFNFPAFLSFPGLLAINIYFLSTLSPMLIDIILYYISILFACGIMFFLFQSLSALLLFGIRSSSLQGVIIQLFSIAEKPDAVFHSVFRKVFTYIIPAFMFSAIPTRVLLGTCTTAEMIALFTAPFILCAIYLRLSAVGNKKLQISGF